MPAAALRDARLLRTPRAIPGARGRRVSVGLSPRLRLGVPARLSARAP
jgi:hypothetical protein